MYSIIIPLYNKADYIEMALNSVLSQTFKDFELIIINDGSTDNSFEVLTKFDFKAIDYQIINQVNAGVSTTRNNGVKFAKYSYIAFLDADDWWEPTFLEEMSNLIFDFPDAGIYGSGYYIVKGNIRSEDTIGVDKKFNRGIINYCEVYAKTLCMPLWTGATIVKKKVFEHENGFKPNLKMGEDFDLWIRIALKYPVALIKKPLSNYNQDVDIKARAVDYFKIYEPNSFFIFNLDYLSKSEATNYDLKNLLDKLRAYSLLQYRIQNAHIEEYTKEIAKVNFKNIPLSTRLQYAFPSVIVRNWIKLKIIGVYYLKMILRK